MPMMMNVTERHRERHSRFVLVRPSSIRSATCRHHRAMSAVDPSAITLLNTCPTRISEPKIWDHKSQGCFMVPILKLLR